MRKKSPVREPAPYLGQQLMPFFPKTPGEVVFVAIPKGMLSEVEALVLWAFQSAKNVTTAPDRDTVLAWLNTQDGPPVADVADISKEPPTMVLVADAAALSLIPEHLLVTHVPSYRLDAPADYSWEIGAYDPRGMTWTAIHRLLGHDDYPNPFGRQIESYTALATNPHRTPYQQQKMERLRAELDTAGVGHLATPVEQEKE